MKRLAAAAIVVCLVFLCACRSSTQTGQETQPSASGSFSVPAQNATPYPSIGSLVPGGAMVTSYSADGSCFYAAFNYEDGQTAVEFTYDSASGTVLFRTDYVYENAALTKRISQTVSDRFYAYTTSSGGQETCNKTEICYENGREAAVYYYDNVGQVIAKRTDRYGADGGRVSILCEYGRLRYLRCYAYDGAMIYTSENGLGVGTQINFGSFGKATVVAVGADGSFTLRFSDRTHRMSDGTFYAGLDLFAVVNCVFEPAAAVFSVGSTAICEYQISTLADGSTKYDYYEDGVLICTQQYSVGGQQTALYSAVGADFFSDAAVSVGDSFGKGSVCETGTDGSFTVVYFDRTYVSTDGYLTPGTTLYAFFDAQRNLTGNKYYYANQIIAESDYRNNADGSFLVSIRENGKAVTLSSDGSRIQ